MLISKKYIYLLSLIILTFNNILAIKVNGEKLSDIIKPDQSLIWSISGDLLKISIKSGEINLKSSAIDNAEKIKSDFNDLKNSSDDSMKLEEIKYSQSSMSSSGDMNYEKYFEAVRGKISFETPKELNILSSILISREIVFACKKINLENFYFNTNILRIEIDSPKSLCRSIQFKFKKNFQLPHLIKGKIDFENNKTSKELVVVGVEEVEITFSPKAF